MNIMEPISLGNSALLNSLVTVVANWCEMHASINSPKSSLRTRALCTQSVEWDKHLDESMMSEDEWKTITKDVMLRRGELMQSASRSPQLSKDYQTKGRLLAFQCATSLHDGSSQYSSDGLFDLVDSPPWDTWILFATDGYVTEPFNASVEDEGYLISWIPSPFIDLAQKGIDTNTTECLKWIVDANTPLSIKLKELGWR